jgi:hypothetical protein
VDCFHDPTNDGPLRGIVSAHPENMALGRENHGGTVVLLAIWGCRGVGSV